LKLALYGTNSDVRNRGFARRDLVIFVCTFTDALISADKRSGYDTRGNAIGGVGNPDCFLKDLAYKAAALLLLLGFRRLGSRQLGLRYVLCDLDSEIPNE
jgi:hypothetical protein